TGLADSGTLEEIERVATQGKPVMLYFSQARQDPDRIEIEQLRKLREFKQKTFPKALVETFGTQIEFRDKLAKQIEIELRSLLAQASEEPGDGSGSRPITEIKFAFADAEKGVHLGTEITVTSNLLELEGLAELPDYSDPNTAANTGVNVLGSSLLLRSANTNYYRELAEYYVRSNFFRSVRFWIKNVGAVGARDCYIDIRISSNEDGLAVMSLSKARLTPPSKSTNPLVWDLSNHSERPVEQFGNEWNTYLEVP